MPRSLSTARRARAAIDRATKATAARHPRAVHGAIDTRRAAHTRLFRSTQFATTQGVRLWATPAIRDAAQGEPRGAASREPHQARALLPMQFPHDELRRAGPMDAQDRNAARNVRAQLIASGRVPVPWRRPRSSRRAPCTIAGADAHGLPACPCFKQSMCNGWQFT
jgi:hypothetical protein